MRLPCLIADGGQNRGSFAPFNLWPFNAALKLALAKGPLPAGFCGKIV
jgi:hypothetical protein